MKNNRYEVSSILMHISLLVKPLLSSISITDRVVMSSGLVQWSRPLWQQQHQSICVSSFSKLCFSLCRCLKDEQVLFLTKAKSRNCRFSQATGHYTQVIFKTLTFCPSVLVKPFLWFINDIYVIDGIVRLFDLTIPAAGVGWYWQAWMRQCLFQREINQEILYNAIWYDKGFLKIMKYKHLPQDTSHTSIHYYKNLVVCNYAIGGNILGGSIYSQVYRNTCFDHFPPRNPPPPKKKKTPAT